MKPNGKNGNRKRRRETKNEVRRRSRRKKNSKKKQVRNSNILLYNLSHCYDSKAAGKTTTTDGQGPNKRIVRNYQQHAA